jgi:multiple sugar transport system substrate-binding protein
MKPSRARRGLAGILVAGVAAVGVAACGGSSGGNGAAGSTGAGTTITYWASNQGASVNQDYQVLGQAIKMFRSQTGINVKVKVIPWPDLFNQISLAASSGNGPDVVNIGNTWAPSLQATKAFLPFQGKDLSSVGGRSKFLASSFAATGAPGKVPTSVPLYGLSYGLFYNKRLFREAGIAAPPRTWSQFLADAKKLTKPPSQWGVALEGASITENAHWAFILGRQNGGALFAGSKPSFDSPGIVRGVQDYVNLVGADRVANPSDAQFSDGTQALAQFAKGDTGMIMWQNNAANNLKSDGMKPTDYGVAPVPVVDGTHTPIMTHVAGINVSVFRDSAHRTAALEFVKFLTSPSEQVSLNKSYGSLPVVAAARQNPAFATPELKTFDSILAHNAAPMPLISQEAQMETIVGGAVKSLFATAATHGSASSAQVKSALSTADQQMAAAQGSS